MTSPPVESQSWPRRRWAALIVLVLAGQVGFVFWLAARKTDQPPAPAEGPMIYLPADQSADIPGVSDPTLFVLPSSHGFSGPAWMQFPASSYQLGPWTEPPRPLPLAIPQLGATLAEFVRSNQPRPFELALKLAPEVDALGILPLEEVQSTFSIEGDLADRALLSPLKPASWPAAEILTNTVVQIAVDSAGRVFSAALLVKTGSPEANASALNLARSARFQPLRWIGTRPPPPAPEGLAWGKMVFHWHTIARPNPAVLSTK